MDFRRACPSIARGGALASLASLAALTLALLIAGCSKSSVVNPVPDCDGVHLLVLTSARNLPAGQHNVYLYDLDNAGFRALLNFGGAGADQRAAITVDGKVIAVERAVAAHGQDVLVYDRCGGAFLDRPELNTSGDETQPAFSGDGFKLAVARDSLGVQRLRLYDGLKRRFLPMPLLETLASAGTSAADPSLDRTANLVACYLSNSLARSLVVYDRGGDTLLTEPGLNAAGPVRDPWLTPDGRYLAFAADRPSGHGGFDIYLYDLQARTYVATDSLNSAGNDSYPTTSPDALFMVFQSDRTGSPAKGKWDIYNYARNTKAVNQSYQESSSEDDMEPGVAWP